MLRFRTVDPRVEKAYALLIYVDQLHNDLSARGSSLSLTPIPLHWHGRGLTQTRHLRQRYTCLLDSKSLLVPLLIPCLLYVLTEFEQNGPRRLDSENTVHASSHGIDYGSTSPSTPDAALGPQDKRLSSVILPLDTTILPEIGIDRPTPRAQTRQEVDEEWKRQSRRTSSLEGLSSLMLVCLRCC
jgi:hypothetical protein